jgi:hypothetical protein
MNNRALILLTLFLTLPACADLQRQADDYDTSILARTLSVCDGEMWVSNEADEKLCVRRSNWDHNTFLITQDAAEYWTDMLTILLTNYTLSFAGPSVYEQFLDDDSIEKWRKAADHFMRTHYGAKAEMVAFKKYAAPMGYVFQVKPGDQIPPWEETDVPEFVLASQMVTPAWQEPDKYVYVASGHMVDRKARRQLAHPRSLTAMVQKAVNSSRTSGRASALVRVEVFEPGAGPGHIAAIQNASP